MKIGYEISFPDATIERLVAGKKSIKLAVYSDKIIDLEKNTYLKTSNHEHGAPVHPKVIEQFQWAKEIEDPDAAAGRIERKRRRMDEEATDGK